MARSVNKIILVGNVGRDPEVQQKANGEKVAHYSLATTRRIPRETGFEERTEWHRITVFGMLAELSEEYVRKGDRLYIEGRMQYDSYERDGITIPTAEVQVRELVMLGSPGRALPAEPYIPTNVRELLRTVSETHPDSGIAEAARLAAEVEEVEV